MYVKNDPSPRVIIKFPMSDLRFLNNRADLLSAAGPLFQVDELARCGLGAWTDRAA
ncbi:hypothetical protein [Sorangium sp. So ce854]|uniref:hypothetical protein n=1 Tax=Sorangium sp. So ce854 TaxID=3133322 RepID=UPI003F60316E